MDIECGCHPNRQTRTISNVHDDGDGKGSRDMSEEEKNGDERRRRGRRIKEGKETVCRVWLLHENAFQPFLVCGFVAVAAEQNKTMRENK
jgi:hypothetical protein